MKPKKSETLLSAFLDGELLAGHTFKATDGRYYRRYIQKLKLPESQRTYYGMAVRGPDGVWTIPRRKSGNTLEKIPGDMRELSSSATPAMPPGVCR